MGIYLILFRAITKTWKTEKKKLINVIFLVYFESNQRIRKNIVNHNELLHKYEKWSSEDGEVGGSGACG